MFKSSDYKFIIQLLLLMVSLSAATFLFVYGHVPLGIICAVITLLFFYKVYGSYKKTTKNIIFLLNAIENGDYSFYFSDNRISKQHSELNNMLNRIKDVLINSRREIMEKEEFMTVIVESVPTGIIIANEEGFVKNINQSALNLLGLNSLSHFNQLSMVDETFPVLFKNMEIGDGPTINVTNEKEELLLSLRLSRISLSGESLKIITLNSIGSELEAKEMESWIQLIRVMTHEIMNCIAPITSLSESLLFSFRTREMNNKEDTLHINTVDALETINSTTKGLLNFVESYRRLTRLPKPQNAPVELIPLLKRVIKLYQSEEELIRLIITTENENAIVLADENQLTQVLVNLIKNGIEALNDEINGESGNPLPVIKLIINRQEQYTSIEVKNNGAPIPNDILPHIFVPFFTTKDTGSGIGLSLSRYIMRLHGGTLKHSYTNGWTTFHMVFPTVSGFK